jgi:hypothetical protein
MKNASIKLLLSQPMIWIEFLHMLDRTFKVLVKDGKSMNE